MKGAPQSTLEQLVKKKKTIQGHEKQETEKKKSNKKNKTDKNT